MCEVNLPLDEEAFGRGPLLGGKTRAAVVLLLLAGAPAWAISLVALPSTGVAPHQVTVWYRTDVSGTTEVHYGTSSAVDANGYTYH